MSTLGDLLEDSGWTSAIRNVRIAVVGVAQSFVTGHDVARTVYYHQVTVCVLHKLMPKLLLWSKRKVQHIFLAKYGDKLWQDTQFFLQPRKKSDGKYFLC